MPIPDYSGETFVAYVDISGFKEMMKQEGRAAKALNHFYTSGFDLLRRNTDVHGLFVSDCGVLFVNNHEPPAAQLPSLLKVVEQLNRDALTHDMMLTTSIAYGRFSYHQRLEFEGIGKNPILGYAYMAAFLDNESGTPRIQPGECRIVRSSITHQDVTDDDRIEERARHYYFLWMVARREQIPAFKERYSDAYQQKYRGMLEALKAAVGNRLQTTANPEQFP